MSTKFHCAQRLSTSKIKILFIEQRPSILGLVFRFCSIMLAHAKQIVNAYFNNRETPQMIINQGLQEGLISSAPRSVTQPHQYISLSSPIQYIYQYINTKEEPIHDVASFLCTRSAIACNNQIRCFVKNHPRCIQSRSKKLRNLKSDDPVVSILLSCSFSASRVSISG